jgi:hypothetical protein
MIIVPDPRYFAEKVKADLAPILSVHIRAKAAQDRFKSSGFLTMFHQVRGSYRFFHFLQAKFDIYKNRTNYPILTATPLFLATQVF